MNIILLSGGSGTRLWPLSNNVRSKQFLKVFKRPDGSRESMAQRMYRMIHEVDPSASVTIATCANQVPQIQSQLGDDVKISVEPERRDTFPAIALAAAYLIETGVDESEKVVVCPVDPFVDYDYFKCLQKMLDANEEANITLMGIQPKSPSEKFGYIFPTSADDISSVKEFKEKPDKETAKKYIEQGALWNGGVFAFRLSYLMNIVKQMIGASDYHLIYNRYNELLKISFDYGVVEKESEINVVRFSGHWNDLGTWNMLSSVMEDETRGNAAAYECQNTHVTNELKMPVIALGLKDCIVAATPDGILVADKDTSPKLKGYVKENRPMYERRDWGDYRVVYTQSHPNSVNSLVKELIIDPGRQLSYHTHHHRDEIWTITQGTGEMIIDGKIRPIAPGDSVEIKSGMKHSVKAESEIHIIEVEIGTDLIEDDIERFDSDF